MSKRRVAVTWLVVALGVCAGALALWLANPLGRVPTTSPQDASEPQSDEGPRPTPVAASQTKPPPASQPAAAGPAAPPAMESLLEEELKVAREVGKDFPDNADALALMGIWHARRGSSAEAVQCWQRCLRLDPRCTLAYNQLGLLALRKAEYQEAAALWRKAIQLDPAMTGVHGGLGRALLYLGQPQEAAAELEQNVRISPDSSLSFFLLGQAYSQLSAHDQARQSYEKAIQLQPNDWHPYYGLASLYARLDQPDKAAQYREKFQKLKAADLQAYYRDTTARDDLASVRDRVAMAHATAGQVYGASGKPEQAEQHWRRAAEIDPKNTVCLNRLTALYLHTGRYQEALDTCERLRQLEPEEMLHPLNIGIANSCLGRFDAAEAAFQKAIQLAPRRSTGYRMLATLYLRARRKIPEARTLAETAVRLEPFAANYAVLSEAQDRNGDRQGALEALQKATTLEPGNERYRHIYELLKQRK